MLFGPILWFIDQLLFLFIIVMIIRAVMSWLFAFDILNRRNHAAYQIYDFSVRLTEPFVRPLRRVIPDIGGIDLSFFILFLLIYVVRMYLAELGAFLP